MKVLSLCDGMSYGRIALEKDTLNVLPEMKPQMYWVMVGL